jgi:hypothetical protein
VTRLKHLAEEAYVAKLFGEERLMTFKTSLVAVCCSNASVRSRLRASSSLNKRTFSIAMTA